MGRRHPAVLADAIGSYEKRIKGHVSLEWVILKSDKELEERLASKEYYCFDVLGKDYTSESFSKLLTSKMHWNFVIGGASGLPKEVVKGARALISFSKFTFPHEIVRLLVVEQIYRAFEIGRGSPYHK